MRKNDKHWLVLFWKGEEKVGQHPIWMPDSQTAKKVAARIARRHGLKFNSTTAFEII